MDQESAREEMPMKVALLCDVDQTVYHVGDEAIATMSTHRLRARGAEVVRISRHEKYGPGGTGPGESIPALTFPWPLEQRATYLREIREVLAGRAEALPAHDKLFGIIEQLRAVDAVVIGGGGSLTSRYGWLLDERLATALVARSLGLPVVLSGQGLGPELTDHDRASVRELLEACSLVGLRDEHSVRLARQLCPGHPALVHTLDDALGLGLQDGEAAGPDPQRIVVTLGGDGDPFPREDHVAVTAAVVDELAHRTGAGVELVPHMADPDTGGGDEQAHAELAARLTSPATVRRVENDQLSSRRTTTAGWVVSTRFHPVVFGTAAGSSVLALPLDRYGALRMDGALRNVGLAGAAVPLGALWDPVTGGPSDLVGPVVEGLIARREAERTQLDAARPRLLRAAESWWDTVLGALRTPAAARTCAGAVVDPCGAGLDPSQRWDGELRDRLAPWTPTAGAAAQAPSASVIMRTRDRPRMLDRALQDVLAQTRQDWELVVVNDAGDRKAVDEVLARHQHEGAGRIRVLHREHSRGMEAASNAGLRATGAPAVVVHDDDDTWHATFLQETLAHLEAHPDHDAVVVRTLLVLERETGSGFVEDEVFPSWPQLQGARLLDYIAVNRSVPISMLHRRRVHEQLGEYDESLPVVGDYAFHLALLQRGRVGWIERPLAQWRQRPASTGASGNSMHTHSAGHRHYDAELRERYFQEWTRENGIGLPLFVSKNTETHVARSEERLLQELASLREELRAIREEVAELRGRRARRDPAALGARAAPLAQRAAARALREGRKVLRPRR